MLTFIRPKLPTMTTNHHELPTTALQYNTLGDSILGDVTMVISITGILGNTLLLFYFIKTLAWTRLSDTLYLVICTVDLTLLLLHIPVSQLPLPDPGPGPGAGL